MTEISEKEIGAKVLEQFVRDGWDCYPECMMCGARADLVAIRNGLIAIVECKTSLSVSLFDQIIEWRPFANFLYAATPSRKKRRFSITEKHLFQYFGIGHVSIGYIVRVDEARYLRIPKKNAKKVLDHLHPDMKNYVPGSQATDGFSSPWKRTMRTAIEYVRTHPGCTIKDLVAGIEHHYASTASARASLFKWLEKNSRIRVQWGKPPTLFTIGKVRRSRIRAR